jgi:hypothetical protein
MKKTTPASLAPGLSSDGTILAAIAAYSAPSSIEKILNSDAPLVTSLQAESTIGVVRTTQDLPRILEEFRKNVRLESALFMIS